MNEPPFYDHQYQQKPFNYRNVHFLKRLVEMAGAYYYRDAMLEFCADANATAYPFFEPDNPHDENAIAILAPSGEHLGYVPRDIAADIAHTDKRNLYINPHWKTFYADEFGNETIKFVFDIVKVDRAELLTADELLRLSPINGAPTTPQIFAHPMRTVVRTSTGLLGGLWAIIKRFVLLTLGVLGGFVLLGIIYTILSKIL